MTTSGTSHHSVRAGPRGATSAMAEGRALVAGAAAVGGGGAGFRGAPEAAGLASYASESESPVSRHTDCKDLNED